MTIYIATDIHGRGVRHVSAFADKHDFFAYASQVLTFHDPSPNRSDSIDVLCEKLYDNGVGFGARHHSRISRKNAKILIRDGAEAHHCWNL